jgi:diketogulonate reductase-like aldo/keto reductase
MTGTQPGRRQALKRLAGLAAAAAMDSVAAAESGQLLQRAIPVTGERLPAVGLGTWQTFDVGNDAVGRSAAQETLRLFVSAGGRVVDSSPMYGSSEGAVGDLAAALGVQSRLFIATKVWTTGREQGVEQMRTSAARLRTKRIDLMQVHNLVDLKTHLKTLRQWKEQDLIRYFGITHYTTSAHRELADVIKKERPDFVQFNYSIATRDAERNLLPVAAEYRTAVLINRPFDGSSLFDAVRGKPLPSWTGDIDCETWAQFFLKYILSHPAVTCAIPATRNPKHLVDNMQGGIGRLPDETTRQKMVDYMRAL